MKKMLHSLHGARRLAASVGAAAALAVSASAFAVPTVSIDDQSEAGLILAASGIDILPGTEVITPESWSFHGNLHIPFGDGVLIGTHNFVLLESDQTVSDIFTVKGEGCPDGGNPNIGACQSGPVDFLQQVFVSFQSDGEGPLVAPSTADCTVTETGRPQSCTFALTFASAGLIAVVTSDAVEVPEPAMLGLFGLAFTAFGIGRCKRT
ncbi:MAG: PEP-CTERM sorting domain-containing protein [Candidatus Accumulibacter sp.]|uniref:PEP-CTERM sorting domain-containing protein n=1 Tax=Accumulibacter sp. TaxID=2053492 RepID=UPI0025D1BF1C|nr:PEP-CTERM sorting domain-containing protein [Accumulibacter sp.]MCM8600041.1 PEP-CTERM sorting domain-containing protein [Accumulibacter sp.]